MKGLGKAISAAFKAVIKMIAMVIRIKADLIRTLFQMAGNIMVSLINMVTAMVENMGNGIQYKDDDDTKQKEKQAIQ